MASKKSGGSTPPKKSVAKATKEVAKKSAPKKSVPTKRFDIAAGAKEPTQKRGGGNNGGLSLKRERD